VAPALARTVAQPGRHACRSQRAGAKVIGSAGRNCTQGYRPAPRKSLVKAPRRPSSKPAQHARQRAARPVAAAQTPTTQASAVAATIAATLSTVCLNEEITPEPSNLALVRAAVLCLVNHVRAEHDETPLAPDPDLERAAEEHSLELVADDYFAHVSPSGETPVDRIRATGYIPGPSVGYVIGENLAWGTLDLATPGSIVRAWVASPGHLANILEAHYTNTGIGVVAAVPPSLAGGEPGATYAQEFGVILG
jgi:uncharacterized protein YkwD